MDGGWFKIKNQCSGNVFEIKESDDEVDSGHFVEDDGSNEDARAFKFILSDIDYEAKHETYSSTRFRMNGMLEDYRYNTMKNEFLLVKS